MAHLGLNPLPPTIHHSSVHLSHTTAHSILSTFLSIAELDPSLRPDSVLSERGPSSSSSAANPNLTLAHLGRIKLGMEGKRVGGGTTYHDESERPEFWGSEGLHGGVAKKRKFGNIDEAPQKGRKTRGDLKQGVQTIGGDHEAGEPALISTTTAEEEDQWQDRENYDLAQGDDEVDGTNMRRNVGLVVQDADDTVGIDGQEEEIVDTSVADMKKRQRGGAAKKDEEDVVHRGGGTKVDKAERKRLKKEKSKKEKKTVRQQ